MKTIIPWACDSSLCANIKILRHHISLHDLVFEGCCSHQLFWSQLYLCAFKSKMEGRCGEAESGSVAPDTPEKISRGLHPPLPLMPEMRKRKEVSLRHYFWFVKTLKQNTARERGFASRCVEDCDATVAVWSPPNTTKADMHLTWLSKSDLSFYRLMKAKGEIHNCHQCK